MCIAGSRRGSGESCYQEITPDARTSRHSQLAPIETGLKAAEIAEHVKEAVETQEVRVICRAREGNWTVFMRAEGGLRFARRPPDGAPELEAKFEFANLRFGRLKKGRDRRKVIFVSGITSYR